MKKSTNRVYAELPNWEKAEKKLGKKIYREVICKYLDDLMEELMEEYPYHLPSTSYKYRDNSAVEEEIENLLLMKSNHKI
mgnify:FL=1|tara:strand:- start:56 stop:295 length:240 start_codon:yes stop_codon:yes gene_type:complete